MQNLAGRAEPESTDRCRWELTAAGIDVVEIDGRQHPEVRSNVGGALAGWSFRRQWYYWRAVGPALSPDVAGPLWEQHGTEVRAGGDCACREPKFDGGYPGTGNYDIDTADGLRVFADLLRGAALPETVTP